MLLDEHRKAKYVIKCFSSNTRGSSYSQQPSLYRCTYAWVDITLDYLYQVSCTGYSCDLDKDSNADEILLHMMLSRPPTRDMSTLVSGHMSMRLFSTASAVFVSCRNVRMRFVVVCWIGHTGRVFGVLTREVVCGSMIDARQAARFSC
jgi:hypothetical protein